MPPEFSPDGACARQVACARKARTVNNT